MSNREHTLGIRETVTGITDELPYTRHLAREPLWIPAVALFGVGDILTTLIGFTLGAGEASPVPARLLADAAASVTPETVLTLLTVKTFTFVLFACVWALFPVQWFGLSEGWRGTVPAVLSLFGGAVVVHNSLIIYSLAV